MGTNLCQLEEYDMTHSQRVVIISRAAHIVSLSAFMVLTWAFIFTVL